MSEILKYLGRTFSYKTRGVVTLTPKGKIIGWVLLSYMTEPFRTRPDRTLSKFHSNYWECKEIAEIFLKKGYGVDVIEATNMTFRPRRQYGVFIDIHRNIERLRDSLPSSCIKIFHITGAHWLFSQTAEFKRLLELKDRRGIVLLPRRLVVPFFNLEYADCGTILGNEFTRETFAYAKKELFPIPISSQVTFNFPTSKNWEESKKNFLWLSGSGLVHKGLDRVLEVFANHPEYSLHICASLKGERDFEKAYHKELYETKNITTYGRINITSPLFASLIEKCGSVIFPSSSEGGGGSAINCMHAGLVPIVTRESSVTINDFGILLKDASLEEIEKSIYLFANMKNEEIERRSLDAWKFANENHTEESFSKAFTMAIDVILKKYGGN